MSSPVKVVNQKGERGGKYMTAGGDIHTADIDAIFAHEAAVVGVVSTNLTGTLSAVPIPAGAYWVGRFTSVTLVSGKVTSYVKV